MIDRPLHQRLMVRLLVASALCATMLPARSGTLTATAVSKAGAVMADTVIFATPVGMPVPPATKTDVQTIAQQQMQFTPYVTVVRVGTEIRFPNFDKVEHHVKSFSPAKEFEIKPYQKVTPAPVTFDKTGIVVAYCLFHEWMRAYVMVVDTPYFGKSDDSGVVALDNLPGGRYEVRAWHPDMGTIKQPLLQTIEISAAGQQALHFNFDFNPKKRRMPKPDVEAAPH